MSPEGSVTGLEPAQREQFERDGYLVIDSTGCPESVLDQIPAELEKLYSKPMRKEAGVVYYYRRIGDAWKVNSNVKALALSPALLTLLEELYGRKPLPFQTLNFRVGSQQAPHSDTVHFNSVPSGFMCGVWVALEDIDMDNGPLVYYPGSQRLPELTPKDLGLDADFDHYPEYEEYIGNLIEREGLEAHYATIQKGQALIWAANLLHGGATQQDPERSRHSQVTHYFFEDCKYYTPMTSTDTEITWRNPAWIT